MAEKVNWIPNIRVDIEDLEQSTHGYTGELVKESNKRLIKDHYPRVMEGFRVEISDAANKEITIYGGAAVDGDGRLITNEDTLSIARSITLSGDATYYIEIEFLENLSSTDARAFWDPTFDNGLDPSGDPRPDGRETPQNVSTRVVQDWQIVNPPSTSGFDISTTPGSTKIPIAVITVSGGAITSPLGSPARTVFSQSYTSGVMAIRCNNTRILPNSFDAKLGEGTVNEEDISVVSNDREAGLLTLAAPTTNDHDVGERVLNNSAGAAEFVDELVTYDDPIASTAGDARLRLYQGDTETGYSLSQDTNSGSGESDIQVANLKNYVDFLAHYNHLFYRPVRRMFEKRQQID